MNDNETEDKCAACELPITLSRCVVAGDKLYCNQSCCDFAQEVERQERVAAAEQR